MWVVHKFDQVEFKLKKCLYQTWVKFDLDQFLSNRVEPN